VWQGNFDYGANKFSNLVMSLKFADVSTRFAIPFLCRAFKSLIHDEKRHRASMWH
jgi:hypothetical protein